MPAKALSDNDFIELFRSVGPFEMSKKTGLGVSGIQGRRRRLEAKLGAVITGPRLPNVKRDPKIHPGRICVDVKDGIVLCGGDAHYWPGDPPLMHRAFVHFIKTLDPVAVVLNGDVLDAASVSRHPPIGWEKQPTLAEEIETAQDRLDEIAKASNKRGMKKIWCLGNHDSRMESRIAQVAPEFAKIHGMHLRDHFPLWEPAWAAWINADVEGVIPLVVKHRFRGGNFAPYNNTLQAGTHMATSHLHSAKIIAHTDYLGTRYGVDLGCMADPNARAFLGYTEDSPKNWREAFGVFTFRDHKMMQPELVLKWDDDTVQFRGELVAV